MAKPFHFATEEAWEAMSDLERAYHDGDLRSLMFAVSICHCQAKPLPGWVASGMHEELNKVRFTKGAKHGGHDFHRRNFKHGWRWRQMVRLRSLSHDAFKKETGKKKTWLNTFEAVADIEASTGHRTRTGGYVTGEDVKKSYELVQRDFNAGKGGRFLEPFEHWSPYTGPYPLKMPGIKIKLS